MSLPDLTFWDYVVNLLDILLVWFIIYKLFNIIRGTKAIQLLKGIFVIVSCTKFKRFDRIKYITMANGPSSDMGSFGYYHYFST